MSNSNKFLSLIKTINSYGQDVTAVWGDITKDTAETVALKQYDNVNLVQFLLKNRNYYDALTLLSYLSICSNEVINAVYTYHHRDYVDILSMLSTDKMILLYEQYHLKVHEQNKGLTSTDVSFTNNYRKVISKKYLKSKSSRSADNNSSKYISTIINEYKFLTFEYINDFFVFLLNIKTIDYVTKFTDLYAAYKQFTLIIDKLINEYYLEYIRYQFNNINNMCGNSFIILEPYYKNIINCIKCLPVKYIDVNYQNNEQFTIIHYIAYLPVLEQNMNIELCNAIENIVPKFRTDLIDNDNNSVIHAAVLNDNFTLIDIFLHADDIDDTAKLSTTALIKNSSNRSVYDILIEKDRYDYVSKIAVDKLPDKVKNALIDKIINNFDTVNFLIEDKIYAELFFTLINYYFDTAVQLKTDIFYDIIEYNRIITKIVHLISVLDQMTTDICTVWLLKSITIDEIQIFDAIVKKLKNKNVDIKNFFNSLPGAENDTFMFVCINMNRLNFVEYIAKFKPDLNLVGKSGYSSIIAALNCNNQDIISVLINCLDDKDDNDSKKISDVCKNVLCNYQNIVKNNKQFSYSGYVYNFIVSYVTTFISYFRSTPI